MSDRLRSLRKNDRGAPTLRRAKTFDPEKALADVQSHRPLHPARNPPETSLYDYIPPLRLFRWMFTRFRKTIVDEPRKGKKKDQIESNVPVEITIYLSGCVVSSLVSPDAFVNGSVVIWIVR
jgi:hypothetical protein